MEKLLKRDKNWHVSHSDETFLCLARETTTVCPRYSRSGGRVREKRGWYVWVGWGLVTLVLVRPGDPSKTGAKGFPLSWLQDSLHLLIRMKHDSYLWLFPLLNPPRKSLCFSEIKSEWNKEKVRVSTGAFCYRISLKPFQAPRIEPKGYPVIPTPGLNIKVCEKMNHLETWCPRRALLL